LKNGLENAPGASNQTHTENTYRNQTHTDSSFIFNGGEGRFSSSAAAGGAGGGLGIATGAEGATTREERGSSEEGGAPADIGRGGRSTCGLAGIDRGSRRIEIAKRARSCGREIEIGMRESKTLGIDCSGRWGEATPTRKGFIAREDESQSRFRGILVSHIPHAVTRQPGGRRRVGIGCWASRRLSGAGFFVIIPTLPLSSFLITKINKK